MDTKILLKKFGESHQEFEKVHVLVVFQITERLPVDPLNLEDFTPNDELYVGVMLEPIIKEKGTSKVLRNGKVFLVAK